MLVEFSKFHMYFPAFDLRTIGLENAKDIMPSSGLREAKNYQYADETKESGEGVSRKNSKLMDLNKVPFTYSC